MADALLSPAVGGVFWAASAGLVQRSARRVSLEGDDARVPLMGVMGAFVFAAQMINFTIPGTGSSGHLGGGLLLAVLLGPHRAFLTIASVLVVQCLLFADGGLLALGCNVFNLGALPAFVAYPLIYRSVAGRSSTGARVGAACVAAAVAGLIAGSFFVVLQTVTSGVSSLPFKTFLTFMLPIHAAIGVVEGLVTFGVLRFVARTQPDLLPGKAGAAPVRKAAVAFALAALLAGGVLSWFASDLPDGLEWSIARTAGTETPVHEHGRLHALLSSARQKVALLPDYGLPAAETDEGGETSREVSAHLGTSLSGILGSLVVVILAGAAGLLLRYRARRAKPAR